MRYGKGHANKEGTSRMYSFYMWTAQKDRLEFRILHGRTHLPGELFCVDTGKTTLESELYDKGMQLAGEPWQFDMWCCFVLQRSWFKPLWTAKFEELMR